MQASVAQFRVAESRNVSLTSTPVSTPIERPKNRVVAALTTIGRGGAARNPQLAAVEDGWEEF